MHKALINKIVNWVKKQVSSAKAKGVVMGLSGGVDSSVTGALCKRAFPRATLGLLMPCFSNPADTRDAKFVAQKFGIKTKLVKLDIVLKALFKSLEGKAYKQEMINIAIANLKPRLRMIILYYYANKLNYLVVGSGNKSELMVGYFTKYGDSGVDILPLGGLLKSQVKELAKELNIPERIIKKVPTAGLWPGQTDEGEMGIAYDAIDKILSGKLSRVDKKGIKKVKERIALTEHKRKPPKAYEV